MRRIFDVSFRRNDRRGIVALEYAILAALMMSAVMAGSASLGPGIADAFQQMAPAQFGLSAVVIDNQNGL